MVQLVEQTNKLSFSLRDPTSELRGVLCDLLTILPPAEADEIRASQALRGTAADLANAVIDTAASLAADCDAKSIIAQIVHDTRALREAKLHAFGTFVRTDDLTAAQSAVAIWRWCRTCLGLYVGNNGNGTTDVDRGEHAMASEDALAAHRQLCNDGALISAKFVSLSSAAADLPKMETLISSFKAALDRLHQHVAQFDDWKATAGTLLQSQAGAGSTKLPSSFIDLVRRYSSTPTPTMISAHLTAFDALPAPLKAMAPMESKELQHLKVQQRRWKLQCEQVCCRRNFISYVLMHVWYACTYH